MNSTDPHLDTFETHRNLLMGVAYRMLGSASDAEDMVQETWLRWKKTDPASLESPRGWLVRVISRICLDHLKTARVQREKYFGTWLPEPLLAEHYASPATEVDESISVALLLVLEKLSPAERAGFLLHDVFGLAYGEISEILEKPEPVCRKLVSRARLRVRSERPRFTSSRAEHEKLLKRFLEACREGELGPLRELLSDAAALYSDGGGKAAAVPEVLTGNEAIARFFIGVVRNIHSGKASFEFSFTAFNGSPGVLFKVGGRTVTAMTLAVSQGKITALYAHRNPDKLREFG